MFVLYFINSGCYDLEFVLYCIFLKLSNISGSSNWPNNLLGINIRLLNYVDNRCWQYYNGLILLQQFLNKAHFPHFPPWLPYFWCFQVISLFKELKVRDNIQSYCRIISLFSMFCLNMLKIILIIWITNLEIHYSTLELKF